MKNITEWTPNLTVLRSEVVDGWQRVKVDVSASSRFFRLARP